MDPPPSTATNQPAPVTAPAATSPVNTAAVQPAGSSSGRRRRVEPLVQLSVRVSSDVRDIADAAADANAITFRQVIETAIREHWGPKT